MCLMDGVEDGPESRDEHLDPLDLAECLSELDFGVFHAVDAVAEEELCGDVKSIPGR